MWWPTRTSCGSNQSVWLGRYAEVLVEAVDGDRVAADQHLYLPVIQAGGGDEIRHHFLGVWVGRVLVRKVGLDHDPLYPDRVPRDETLQIIEDRAEDVAGNRGAGELRCSSTADLVALVALQPGVVDPLGDEGHPTDLALGQDHPQLREQLEGA